MSATTVAFARLGLLAVQEQSRCSRMWRPHGMTQHPQHLRSTMLRRSWRVQTTTKHGSMIFANGRQMRPWPAGRSPDTS